MRRLAASVLVVAAAAVLVAAQVNGRGQRPAAPVNRWLPWHAAVVDAGGKLRPWTGYDRVLRQGWRFLERVPVDRRAGVKTFLAYAVFDPQTGQGRYWQHNPASLYGTLVESLLPWYAYSGDRRAVALVREMLDYQLDHGTTPPGWAWGGVPFATSCAGETSYGGCLAGADRGFFGGVEPDKVGVLGLGYLHFYELSGNRRYLRAALASADALAQNVRAGSEARTPWAFRVDGRSGRTLAGAEYGGMLVAPIRLLDELVRLGGRDTRAFARARDVAWRWVLGHQLNSASRDFNRWSGYYEDIAFAPDDLNQAAPTMTAYWLLTRPHPAELDARWLAHARAALEWVRSYLGRGPFLGAWAIDEQRTQGRDGCCSPAGLGSDTARWAAANALLAARTGDGEARDRAVRSLGYATYFSDERGRVSCCGGSGANAYWFSDGYGDYLGGLSWALGALPQLSPPGETHLLASSSVVQRVAYGRGRVAYRTFASHAVETLRLSFRPVRVTAGGRGLPRRRALSAPGWTLDRAGDGYVVRVRHDGARRILLTA
ncbi:MAG TPA: hypothetical protein VIU44_03915 [Gaiellaceae bacterium]